MQKNFAHTDEIVATLAEQTGVHKRDVKAVLSALPNFIRDELDAGNSVRLFRMVTLQRTDTAARTMNHIKTKEKYTMPAMKITRAKVCSFLKK